MPVAEKTSSNCLHKYEEFLLCMPHSKKKKARALSFPQNDEVLPRRAVPNHELLLLMLYHASSENHLLCSRRHLNPSNGVKLTARSLIHDSCSFASLLGITFALGTRQAYKD